MGQKFKKRKSQSVFGATLQAVNMHYQQSPHEVPYLVQEMILFIKRYGLSCEKLFIKNGDEVTTHQLKKMYNKEGTVKLDKYSKHVLSVAALLKQFLAELKDPLLTIRFGSTFIKTQGNPDYMARLRNMKKLIQALPATNWALLKSLLDVLRLVLHHRHKNKLTTNELCTLFGPIILGVDVNTHPDEVPTSVEVLKTLIVQNLYLLGITEEPASIEEIPIFIKRSKKLNSKGKAWMLNRGMQSYSDDYDESNASISLIDAVVGQVVATCVHNILFEPQVRISYNYETKIPNHIKKLYAVDKLIEVAVHPEKRVDSKNINRSISYAVNVDDSGHLFRRKSVFTDEGMESIKVKKKSHEELSDRPRGFTHSYNEGDVIIDKDIFVKIKHDNPHNGNQTHVHRSRKDSIEKSNARSERSKLAPKRSTSSPLVKKPVDSSNRL